MPKEIFPLIARTASICLALLAVLWSFRLLAEAWTRPLGGATAFACVFAAALCLSPGSLRDWLKFGRNAPYWAGLCTGAVWWCAGIIIVHQISTGPQASWILWLPILAAEAWSRQEQAGKRNRVVGQTAVQSDEPTSVTPTPGNVASFEAVRGPVEQSKSTKEVETNQSTTLLDAGTMQQWTRQRTAGEESQRGLIRVCFADQDLVAVVHVSFSPPFTAEPELEVATVAGDEADVSATNVFPYGARLEVKRAKAEGVAEAIVEVLAATSR